MTQPDPSVCPYLGLAGEPTTARTEPDTAHRCFARHPAAMPDLAHQTVFCLASAHKDCPYYDADAKNQALARSQSSDTARRKQEGNRGGRAWRLLPWAALAALAMIVIAIYARDLIRPAVSPTATPTEIVIARSNPGPTGTSSPTSTEAPRAALAPSSTPEPGGRVLTLTPKEGKAGWFASREAAGNHLGDSFLYAGYFGGQAFISALRIELSGVPRGAPIREATLRLTGLNADRFAPAAGGVWTVQFLAARALPDFTAATFQELLNAPGAVTLVPALYPADLGASRSNIWFLDAEGRAWLEQQLLNNAEAIIARLTGPAGGADTLFAWDSGAGPATLGEGPQLVLNLGAVPPTPPPLPTEAVIVATLTATPANVLTAAADAWTATAVARTTGTYTPLPYRAVTPTPRPANLATVQAQALARGLPPVVPDTPTPANQTTADINARFATAQAFLTGTPTATPRGAVTPVVLTPTPGATNVLTEAARFLQATADAATTGTPTPWPYNAVVATLTPPWIVITSTPQPANAATAQAHSVYATAVSLVIGTFTPLPPNAATPTPIGFAPSPTAIPLPPGAGTAAPALLVPGCPDPRVQITSPIAGQAVSGRLTLRGTAIGEAFEYARLEVAAGSPPSGVFIEFGRFTFPIPTGRIGFLETATLPNGPYTLRLTVLDQAGNALPACEVGILIQNE